MAWTATIKDVIIEPPTSAHSRRLAVEVEFTDGVDFVVEKYFFDNPTVDQLKQQVKRRIVSLTTVTDFADDLVIGAPVDTSDKPPSQDDLDKQAFFAAYSKLQQLLTVVNAGGTTKADQQVADLKVLIDSLYKPEYFA